MVPPQRYDREASMGCAVISLLPLAAVALFLPLIFSLLTGVLAFTAFFMLWHEHERRLYREMFGAQTGGSGDLVGTLLAWSKAGTLAAAGILWSLLLYGGTSLPRKLLGLGCFVCSVGYLVARG